MPNIEQGLMSLLYNYLLDNRRASRDELRILAYNNKFDMATADRKLRKLTELGLICPYKGSKGFNSGYSMVEAETPQKTANLPEFNAKTAEIESLDDQLKEVLSNIIPSWENFEKIKEIQSALKSSHKYLKESLIRKYVISEIPS